MLRPLGPVRELCALKDRKSLEAVFQRSRVTAGIRDIRFNGNKWKYVEVCGIAMERWNYMRFNVNMWNFVELCGIKYLLAPKRLLCGRQ